MSITKFNKTNHFIFKAPEGFKYYSLKDLVKANGADMIYPVLALYINNKGRYGAQPLAVTDKFFVNLPSHLVNDVSEMINDRETVDQINSCKAGFRIRSYTNRNGGESYSVEWMNIDSPADVKLPF